MFPSQSPTRTNIEEANKHLKMLYGRVDELEKKVVLKPQCLVLPALRYFPRRSRLNQTNQLFLEDILLKSLLAHLKVT